MREWHWTVCLARQCFGSAGQQVPRWLPTHFVQVALPVPDVYVPAGHLVGPLREWNHRVLAVS